MRRREKRQFFLNWQVGLTLLAGLWIVLGVCSQALAFTVEVVDVNGDPVNGFRYLVEEDNTTLTVPHTVQVDPPSISMDIHSSHAPIVASGDSASSSASVDLPADQRYFVSVLPDGDFALSGASVPATTDFDYVSQIITVTVNPLPLPTSQISLRAFVDDNWINNVWDEREAGLGGVTFIISDAGGQVTQDAFGNPLGTSYVRVDPNNPNSEFEFDFDGNPVVDELGTGVVKSLTAIDYWAALGFEPDGVTPLPGGPDPSRNPHKLLIGEAHVKFLVPNKYGVVPVPPAFDDLGNPMTWSLTSTIEGTPTVDAWVKSNEPEIFVEGFGTGRQHAFYGFVKITPTEASTFLGQTVKPPAWNITDTTDSRYVDRSAYTGTIEGTVRINHFDKPPALQGFYPGPAVEECWVGLNDPIALAEAETVPFAENPAGTELLPPNFFATFYAAQCNPDGTFVIENVPPGEYQLVTWDTPLDTLFGFHTVTVPAGPGGTGEPTDLGDVLTFRWFGTIEGRVFLDNGGGNPANARNGFPDPGEIGILDQAINLRFRDGTIYQATVSDPSGEFELAEVFPFFKWLVLEVDFARFKATGMTTAVDDGGFIPDVLAPVWPSNGNKALQPQDPLDPANENGTIDYRTETGEVLTQAVHTFLTQTNLVDWGKDMYLPGENGGISGLVFYAVTRAEDDPRYAAAEGWEPGIPRVQVNLYVDAFPGTAPDGVINDRNGSGMIELADVDNYPLGWGDGTGAMGSEDVDHNGNGNFDWGDAVNVTWTDSWDDNKPSGCVQNLPVIHGITIPECADSFGTWNQVRPGVFDGGYAFGSYFPDGPGGAEVSPMPTAAYLVETANPPHYELLKEEDKNVDFGETYTPSPLALPPACVNYDDKGDGVMGHLVPPVLSFDGVTEAPFAGEVRPYCDRKQIFLNQSKNAAVDFFYFTQVPKAARSVGFANNDLAAEFNQASPIFGEKSAAPWIPISFKDWTGREITRVYADEFGHYNTMLPSTYTVNIPSPTGVSPNMITAVLNEPLLADGTVDPLYNPVFSVTPWTFDYMPGKTTYLDTPLVPLAAFSSADIALDTAAADGSPVIASVAGGTSDVPLLCSDLAETTITLTSLGLTQVQNPDFDVTLPPEDPNSQFYITRDYGFGDLTGTVTLNGVSLSIVDWTDSTIVATVPGGATTGEILVTEADGIMTQVGVTLTITDCSTTTTHIVRQDGTGDFETIQAAIDAAGHGDTIFVSPGQYNENVIMYKPVVLQGSGPGSTIIFANPSPREKLQAWHDRVELPPSVELAPGVFGLNGQAFEDFLLKPVFTENEAPGILVVGELCFPDGIIDQFGPDPCANKVNEGNSFTTGDALITNAIGVFEYVTGDPIPSRIDGFGIRGAIGGGGIYVFGGARGLVITNNEITNNQGNYAGGISLGAPDAGFQAFDEDDFRQRTAGFSNLDIIVRNNKIHKNSAFQGVGGICAAEDAHRYLIESNLVTGNFGRWNGGGIAHVGRSDNGVIRYNDILFNETFFNAPFLRAGDGGGILIAGDAVRGGTGSGSVTIEANLIQGNSAAGGYGGGIRLFAINGLDIRSISDPDLIALAEAGGIPDPWPVFTIDILDNIIVNNVAGISGGGISMQDAAYVNLINNTIANNDSTATAALAFAAGAPNSTPRPAGVVGAQHSAVLQDLFTQAGTQFVSCPPPYTAENCVYEFLGQTFPTYSDPVMESNIIWHNRSFFNDASLNAGAGGLAPNPAGLYWDLSVIGTGGTPPALNPDYSILSSLTGPDGEDYNDGTNQAADPAFILGYTNDLVSGTVTDEGGNYINILFTPLDWSAGNYHITGGSPAVDTGKAIDTFAYPELTDDFDVEMRPGGPGTDVGADEIPGPAVLGLFSPNGGEVLGSGTKYKVLWNPQANAAFYRLRYSADAGATWNFVARVDGGTSYDWTVPVRNSPNVLFRVTALASDGTWLARDDSDAPFTIRPTLLQPNGGELLIGQQVYDVRWSAFPNAAFYRLRYSADGGVTWNFVARVDGATNYNWTVPNADTTNALFRVVAYTAGGSWLARDDSDASFTIMPGSTLVQPNGGEVMTAGEFVNIQWTPFPDATIYRLRYSVDGGGTWNFIGRVDNFTSYVWEVPNEDSANVLVRVTAHSAADNWLARDESDAPFTIQP